MNQNERLDSDICIIMLDFAENDQYTLQDEIQSFHGMTANAAFTQLLLL